jgi:hypothetical protein
MACKVTRVTIPPEVLLLFVLWNDKKSACHFEPDLLLNILHPPVSPLCVHIREAITDKVFLVSCQAYTRTEYSAGSKLVVTIVSKEQVTLSFSLTTGTQTHSDQVLILTRFDDEHYRLSAGPFPYNSGYR